MVSSSLSSLGKISTLRGVQRIGKMESGSQRRLDSLSRHFLQPHQANRSLFPVRYFATPIYIYNWICGDSYLISLLFLYVESTKRGTCERCGGRPSANRRYGVGYTSHSFDFCKTQNYNPWKGTFVYLFFFLFKFFIHIWVSFIFALVS